MPILCTVDTALIVLSSGQLCVSVHERTYGPEKGKLALPGVVIDEAADGSAEAAAYRAIETKLRFRPPYIEQLRTYSGRKRDERGWSITVVYYALVSEALFKSQEPSASILLPVADVASGKRALAFDHAQIVADVGDRIRSKGGYSSLPLYLLDDRFTLAQAQAVYEAVLGKPLQKANFKRKLDDLGAIEAIPDAFVGKTRPAQLYRIKPEIRGGLITREALPI